MRRNITSLRNRNGRSSEEEYAAQSDGERKAQMKQKRAIGLPGQKRVNEAENTLGEAKGVK
jgi:hypothetical protein